MREVFAKGEIKTRVFSGENQEAGNCCPMIERRMLAKGRARVTKARDEIDQVIDRISTPIPGH